MQSVSSAVIYSIHLLIFPQLLSVTGFIYLFLSLFFADSIYKNFIE